MAGTDSERSTPRAPDVNASPMFPTLHDAGERLAVKVSDGSMTYGEVRYAAAAVAGQLHPSERVALWAEPTLEACIGAVGTLMAGAVVVPVNPRSGPTEIEHVVVDSGVGAVINRPDGKLPRPLARLQRIDADPSARGPVKRAWQDDPEAAAFIIYTSGTTGAPKGVVIPRRAVTSNLDALAETWEWTADDVLAHALPLFHVHGLVLGLVGPLRIGGALHHTGAFSAPALVASLVGGATMIFGVPTMYRDLAGAAEADPSASAALQRARLLVTGSAPLPIRDWRRIEQATGQRIVERYGLTETLMNCATPARGPRRPGYVGPPLPEVDVRLVDEDGRAIEASDDETIGEIVVRGPNLFLGYLNLPQATRAALRDGWLHTGDLATRDFDGWIRIVGRRATDLIKTGGFRVGAGEVEAALLEHPAVAEAAVTGEPDERLGDRIVAWVVLRDDAVASSRELQDHVAWSLAPHKRPRAVNFVPSLPRNAMGKVLKPALRDGSPTRISGQAPGGGR